MRHCVIAALTLLGACSPELPEVFVPGPGFSQSIQLSTPRGDSVTMRVGEPLILNAQRRTGPWVAAARSALAPDACWLGAVPLELEPEVADNLKWLVEPAGAATFNVDYRTDRTREVRFSAAGLYRLSAESANWCAPRYGGNSLTVVVVAR